MRHLRNALLVVIVFLPGLSRAQTIFDVSGTLSIYGGPLAGTAVGSFSGTIDINRSTGQVTGWNISMPFIPASSPPLLANCCATVGAFTFTPSNSSFSGGQSDLESSIADIVFSSAAQPGTPGYYYLRLGLDTGGPLRPAIPIGFSGATIVSGSDSQYFSNGAYYLANGGIQMSPAPEPSTFVLMASGLCGIFGLRRKLF